MKTLILPAIIVVAGLLFYVSILFTGHVVSGSAVAILIGLWAVLFAKHGRLPKEDWTKLKPKTKTNEVQTDDSFGAADDGADGKR